jgi:hypothetical protein
VDSTSSPPMKFWTVRCSLMRSLQARWSGDQDVERRTPPTQDALVRLPGDSPA